MTKPLRTDEISDFDMAQLLLFEEALHRHQSQFGRVDARNHAAAELVPVFDTEAWQIAANDGTGFLPSLLAGGLSMVDRRKDWPVRREGFSGPARTAHLAEAERREACRHEVPRSNGCLAATSILSH